VSAAVRAKVIRSPLTGLWMTCPVYAMIAPWPGVGWTDAMNL
jgi:hypothetical protein